MDNQDNLDKASRLPQSPNLHLEADIINTQDIFTETHSEAAADIAAEAELIPEFEAEVEIAEPIIELEQADELPPETETHFTETPEIEETIGLIDAIHEDIAAIQDDPAVSDEALSETTEDNIDYDLPLAEPTYEEIESITADNLDIIEEVLSEEIESFAEDTLAITDDIFTDMPNITGETPSEPAVNITDDPLLAEAELIPEFEAEVEIAEPIIELEQADELPPETETHFTETPEIEETIGLIDAIHEDIAAIQDDPVVFDGVLNETTEDNIDYDLPLAEPTHEEIESITADNLDIIEEVLSEDTESITEDNLAVTEEVPNEALDSSDENNEEIADEVLSEATTDTYLTAESEFTGETEAEPELIVTEQTEPELPQGEDLFAVIQNSLAKTSEILDNPPEEPLTNRPAAELALNTETEAAALPLSKDFSQKIMEQVSPEDLAKLQAALAKTDVNAKDSFGITPLGLAVSYGQLHTVAVLLTNGANIKATNNYGATAIHATTKLAAGPNKEDILTLLLEHGADINAKDNYGQTALHIEARFGQLPALEYLLKHGAAINQLDNKGAAALNYAVLRGDTSLVYSLLMAGAKSNIIDGYGRPLEDWVSPTDKIMLKLIRNFKLVQSIAKGSALEDIDDLLHKGADVNSFSFEGTPALHLAITHQDSSILVKLLLESGAQINLTDNLGHTALHLASLHNKIELIDLLLSYGIKINGRNNNGFTALELAEQNNFSELAALLQQRGAHGQLSKGTLANNEVKKETTKNKDGYEESPLHRLIKKQAAAQPKND